MIVLSEQKLSLLLVDHHLSRSLKVATVQLIKLLLLLLNVFCYVCIFVAHVNFCFSVKYFRK